MTEEVEKRREETRKEGEQEKSGEGERKELGEKKRREGETLRTGERQWIRGEGRGGTKKMKGTLKYEQGRSQTYFMICIHGRQIVDEVNKINHCQHPTSYNEKMR